ncbi:polysaccharide deacetylase family protein [Polyangium jinanense]|uniref:Polysaccharide deacetylase family protein n=1 Tax=Polyangium jinanense TaxID=2829994 RepID=A0A9X3XD03_9BACT|nr:polysaccharide deacetylase family protein [Polyangium jinanense]MDC3960499.1 polysaccharide deacetylase family protein [Polyangium jinanense]MDC3986728.1 polysaccharide deacetylase family protein [Polyangium jinanense]
MMKIPAPQLRKLAQGAKNAQAQSGRPVRLDKDGTELPINACPQMYRAILTFDDGPEPTRELERIIAILNDNGIRGVFYLLGEETKRSPDAARLIVESGHIAQSHSWDHEGSGLVRFHKKQDIVENLNRAQMAIAEATGKAPTRLRPPFGARNQLVREAVGEVGLKLTLWDIDTNDWRKPKGLDEHKFSPARASWKKMYDERKHPLDILMHVQQETADRLDGFIKSMKGDCWQFTVYEGA